MFGASNQGTRANRRRDPNGRKPTLEGLEQRLLLYSTLGGQWQYGARITYSIPADGTNAGGIPSELSQAMTDRGITESQWKTELRRAAAVWQSAANINLAEVSDSGAALGVPGNQQNDPRFGDIRFFATPQQPGVLGYAFQPPPINGGTRAGDVVFNADAPWAVDTNFDLQTVAIHELGHSLGLGHSTFSASAMYDTYNGVKQGLISDDINGIQSLYGPRQHDWVDQFHDNKDPYNAINFTSWIDSNDRLTLNNLDLTSNQDDDWFYVKSPSGTSGDMNVIMQSKNLSSLSPRFQVYNSALQLVGWTVAPNAGDVYGSTISLRFTGVPAGSGVYIKAMGWNGSSSGVNGIGAYALQVDFSGGPTPSAIVSPPDTTVLEQPDQGGGTIQQVVADGSGGAKPWYHNVAPMPAMGFSGMGSRFSTWDDSPSIDPSYETVTFQTPDRPGLPRFFAATRSFGNVSPWFTLAVDTALEEQVEVTERPSSNSRWARWVDEAMNVELQA